MGWHRQEVAANVGQLMSIAAIVSFSKNYSSRYSSRLFDLFFLVEVVCCCGVELVVSN